MAVKLVLDTSALLSGMDFDGDLYTSQHILDELHRQGTDPRMEALLETKVKVREPSAKSIAETRRKAAATGDARRLSPTDIRVLALALDLQGTIVTDDYSIQNVAKELGVPYRGAGLAEIREGVEWHYRCTGCGRYLHEPLEICPVCGSPVKTTRRAPPARG